jgi:hypothetical protein
MFPVKIGAEGTSLNPEPSADLARAKPSVLLTALRCLCHPPVRLDIGCHLRHDFCGFSQGTAESLEVPFFLPPVTSRACALQDCGALRTEGNHDRHTKAKHRTRRSSVLRLGSGVAPGGSATCFEAARHPADGCRKGHGCSWVNTTSGLYHQPNSRYYGKT